VVLAIIAIKPFRGKRDPSPAYALRFDTIKMNKCQGDGPTPSTCPFFGTRIHLVTYPASQADISEGNGRNRRRICSLNHCGLALAKENRGKKKKNRKKKKEKTHTQKTALRLMFNRVKKVT